MFVPIKQSNGFDFAKSSAISLFSRLRTEDQLAIVNTSDESNEGSQWISFNESKADFINNVRGLNPNSTGTIADRIYASYNLFNAASANKKVIILFSAGEIYPVELITDPANLSLDKSIKIYTMGYKEYPQGQDLLGWLANETIGEYYEI